MAEEQNWGKWLAYYCCTDSVWGKESPPLASTDEPSTLQWMYLTRCHLLFLIILVISVMQDEAAVKLWNCICNVVNFHYFTKIGLTATFVTFKNISNYLDAFIVNSVLEVHSSYNSL